MMLQKTNNFTTLESTQNRTEAKHNIYKVATNLCVLGAILTISDSALAFDLTVIGPKLITPLLGAALEHYKPLLFLAGMGGMFLATGDLKQRGMLVGTGCVVAGLICEGMKYGLGVQG